MTQDRHYAALQNLYLAAPINDFYRPSIEISDAETKIEMEVSEKLFHGFGAVHGCVYFKMLDDAAFFAVSSLERDVLVLTTSFTTYLTRPVSSGTLRSGPTKRARRSSSRPTSRYRRAGRSSPPTSSSPNIFAVMLGHPAARAASRH